MGEDKKSIDGVIEKLALLTDESQQLFPSVKSSLIFELNDLDFKKVQNNFREIDRHHTQFKIDISGVEVIFILENTGNEIEILKEQPVIKRTFWDKLSSFISRKSTI